MLQSTGRYNVMKDIAYIKEKTGITLLDATRRPYPKAVNSYTITLLGAWHIGIEQACTTSTLPMPSPTD